MGFFSKKINTSKLLDEALADYKNGQFAACYEKVCKAEEAGNARAAFCKALLIYNDNIAPGSEPDAEVLADLAKKAMNGGYAPAYGLYAFILEITQSTEELSRFCSQKVKANDGVYWSYKASYYFGLYTDDVQADAKTTIAAMKQAISLLQPNGKATAEREEWALYSPYGKFSPDYAYAHANFLLLTAYYCEDDWSTRREFMAAFEEALRYMPSPDEKFRIANQYLSAILSNTLGMSDLAEADRAMKIFKDCYNDLDEQEQEAYAEKLEEVCKQYTEYREAERRKRNERDVTYSDGYADDNYLTLANAASAIASRASSGSSAGSTQTVYTIGGRKYTRGEMGYLYDEEGFKSDYRVDDYARIYDASGTELGYFNTSGLFISSH